jgi:hypothetical protein
MMDSIVKSVIKQFEERSEMGRKKYGTDLDRTDLSVVDYLQHAKEEAMDLTLYLEKAIKMIKEEDIKQELSDFVDRKVWG